MIGYKDLLKEVLERTEGFWKKDNYMILMSPDVYESVLIDFYDRRQITKEELMKHLKGFTYTKFFSVNAGLVKNKGNDYLEIVDMSSFDLEK